MSDCLDFRRGGVACTDCPLSRSQSSDGRRGWQERCNILGTLSDPTLSLTCAAHVGNGTGTGSFVFDLKDCV